MNVYGGEKKCGQGGGSLPSLTPASLEGNATMMAGGKRMRKVSGKARRTRRRSSSAGGSRKRKGSRKGKKSKRKSRKY
jgi:hypothetical protein